jgi:DNA polymerase-4
MTTLREFGVVEVLGWDEAFVAAAVDDPEALARAIHDRVLEVTQLHCSVGIGRNVVQAKVATGYAKPAGVFRLTPENWFETVGALSPDALWGIGSRTAAKLAQAGVSTVAELAEADSADLAHRFGPSTGPWLVGLAQGKGSAAVSDTPWVARSRSRETTFQQDLQSWDDVRTEVSRLATVVGEDIAGDGRPVVRVVVKVRFVPFDTHTHGVDRGDTQASSLEDAALAALEAFTQRRPVRLVGVRVEFGS